MSTQTETIVWINSHYKLPDADITVLAWSRISGEVFLAWRDDETGWHDCASGGECVVAWWADVGGPTE